MDPIGLYIHIPFCLHKCGYCDFNSHPLDGGPTAPYVEAVLAEIEASTQGSARDRTIATVFFGGGTPTLLPAADLARILNACRQVFSIPDDIEITCEANPATLHADYLPHLRAAGFNRLSVGVQSFDEEELKFLERVHNVEEVYQTVAFGRQAGFEDISLDLMFALPGQSLQLWESHLDQALALTPDHLSCYNLTIEPGTSFYRLQGQGKLKIPGEESQLDHFRTTITKLTQAGFKHYEISNFARPGRECRHNRNYWENGEYWGIGAGSSSYLDGVRRRNVKSPDQYVRQIKNRGNASAFEEKLEPRQAMGETLMLGLRLQDGLSLARFEQRFKIPFDQAFGGAAARLLNLNLITLEGGRVALSEKGLYLADSVILEFIE